MMKTFTTVLVKKEDLLKLYREFASEDASQFDLEVALEAFLKKYIRNEDIPND